MRLRPEQLPLLDVLLEHDGVLRPGHTYAHPMTIRRFVLRLVSFFRGFRWLEDSRIDLKLGARMLVKYPGLSIIGGAGLAVGVALGAGFFAFLYSFLYATLPVEGGARIVALENRDLDANNEIDRKSVV